jgi:hypothetical protein
MTPADRMLAASGEMPERPKGVDSKSTVSLWHRGFESLSLRQTKIHFFICFLISQTSLQRIMHWGDAGHYP